MPVGLRSPGPTLLMNRPDRAKLAYYSFILFICFILFSRDGWRRSLNVVLERRRLIDPQRSSRRRTSPIKCHLDASPKEAAVRRGFSSDSPSRRIEGRGGGGLLPETSGDYGIVCV